MKKNFVKSTACALSALLLGSTMVACGGTKPEGYDPLNQDEIKFVVSELGFGTEMYKKIAEAFESTHPGKNVVFETTVMSSALMTQLEAGGFIGDVCMFNDSLAKVWRKDLLTQLDDVVASVPDGEEKSLGEKANPNLIEAYKVSDGHYYSIPWLNENKSFIYNKTTLNSLLDAGNWEVPKTTEELFALCDRVQAAGGYGISWATEYLQDEIWTAQYEGRDAFTQQRVYGKYYDEASGEWKLSDAQNVQCIADNTGYMRSLEVLSNICINYSHPYARDMDFAQAQANFAGFPYAGDETPSAFMFNGDWFYNETEDYIIEENCEVGFMKVPVISSIVEKLSFYEDDNTAFSTLTADKRAAYDATLLAMINYYDNGEEGTMPSYKGTQVTEEDMDIVSEARSFVLNKAQSNAFIPANSTKKDLAKEFLTFISSDMAVEIYSQHTNGYSPYLNKDAYKSISFDVDFMDEVGDILADSDTLTISYLSDLQANGYHLPKPDSYAYMFKVQKKTGKQAFDIVLNYYKGTVWSECLRNAGLANQ